MRFRAVILAACAAACMALCLLACGCAPVQTHYDAEDYFLDVDYSSDYRILQLSDIHLGAKDAQDKQFAFLDSVIRESDCDFIMVTGDSFTYANKATAHRLFDFLDSYGVPWSITFGNHDEQCYFSVDWMTDCLNNYGSNCVFKDMQADDVFGNANFVINLNKDGHVFDQIISLDSNRYNYGEYIGYDYIKQDQIDWYERVVNYSTERNGGQVVPSMLFFHIPVPEMNDAWEAVQAGSDDAELLFGEMREPVCCPDINSGFFAKVKELGSSRAMFFGHDHINDAIVKYQDVYFAYGVTSTDRIYSDPDMIGGRVIVLHDDHSLDFENLFRTYDEVM